MLSPVGEEVLIELSWLHKQGVAESNLDSTTVDGQYVLVKVLADAQINADADDWTSLSFATPFSAKI